MNLGVDVFGAQMTPARYQPGIGLRPGGERPDLEEFLPSLSAAMYVEVAKRGHRKGYEWAELSWTREDDAPINLGIRSMGAKIYKTYRVYEKPLG